ncbi:hypothetical protein [Bacillus thuringiensis]|uniref:Ankyrin repeat protein n=1 Tax=Bacillus thuringiensis TaxID=1428 RepID=A0A9X6WI43_BACTU|nr:hypothetical protein [Bacillus thuringiensis]PFJ32313.1 hypothetical protein COJ15_29015 [Bacillus thuringiensis]
MGAPKHYTTPIYQAVKINAYGTAGNILEQYDAENKKVVFQEYYGIISEGRNNELIWKCIEKFHVLQYDKTITYYKFLRDIEEYKNYSRRINFLFKSSIRNDAPHLFKSHMLSYAHDNKLGKKTDIIIELLKQGADPNEKIEQFKFKGRTFLEKVIQKEDKEMFDIIWEHSQESVFFGNNDDYDVIILLAEKGLLEEWLEDKVQQMTPEQQERYQENLLLNLIKLSERMH